MQRSLLAPGCEKAPPSPDLQYVPPNSTPYKVTAQDNWWSLADRPAVKAAKLSALDLCVFNFRTRNPAEINWYLRNKVGCTTATADRKNYKFSADASPGIVYLPKPSNGAAPIVVDEATGVGRVPGSEAVSGVEEFTVDLESKIFSLRFVRVRLKVTSKLSVSWGNATPEIRAKVSANLLKREFGVAVEANLAQDLSVQYGLKLKVEDARKPGAWKDALAQASEIAVKRKVNNAVLSAVSTGFRVPKDGLFYFIKFTSVDQKMASVDLSWLLDLPPGGATISAKGNVDITVLLGPGEAQLQYFANPGTAVLTGLAAWVAFAGFGIRHTMNKADRMAYESWYVTGYVDAVFPPPGGASAHQLPLKPAERAKAEEMIQLGRRDAEMTARTEFGNTGLPAMQAYGIYLSQMLKAENDPYASRQVRGLLRDLVHEKLKQTPVAS